MKLALAGVIAGVVDVEEDDGRDGDSIHQPCRSHESHQPASAVSLFVISEEKKIKKLNLVG